MILPTLRPQIPYKIMVSSTSNRPQNKIGDHLGPGSIVFGQWLARVHSGGQRGSWTKSGEGFRLRPYFSSNPARNPKSEHLDSKSQAPSPKPKGKRKNPQS